MKTIRSIRIATGIKKVELEDENIFTQQICEVLKEHRETLINSLTSDLKTYIHYTFGSRPTSEQLEQIKHKLVSLKNSNISLSRYSKIITEVRMNESTYVKSEMFYQEINMIIQEDLKPAQLSLVK